MRQLEAMPTRRPPLPRLGRSDPVRPPRRRQRCAREHDAGVRVRGRPRLPLRRDRRAGHGRRRAGRVPRRRPAAHVRPRRAASATCRGARCSTALVGGEAPIPLLEDLLGDVARPAGQHRLQDRRRRARARVGAAAARNALDRVVRRRVQRSPACAPAGATRRRAVHRARARRRRRAAVRPTPAGRGDDRPGARRRRAASPSSTSASSSAPTRSASRCTCGPSTTRPRCTACSTSGVDGLMTDRPAVLREVLERRAHWHG